MMLSAAVTRNALRKAVVASSPLSRSYSATVTELNESLESVQTFQTSNPKSVLYYTATWCGPCRHIKPMYQELADKYESKGIAFGLVDIDANADAAAEVRITSVPTFFSFQKAESVKQFSGADPNQLKQMVEELDQL